MREQMDSHGKLLKAAKELEPLPEAVLELATAVNDPDCGPDEFAEILAADPTLAAHVLREANSAASAARTAIGSLDQAVVRLGAARILEIAIRSQLTASYDTQLLAYGLSGVDRRRHGVGTSLAAEICVRATAAEVSRDVLCAALLHDIGKDVINAVVVPAEAEMLREAGLPVVEIERELVGADHAEVGALILETWRLPASLVAAVRNHHQPRATTEAAIVCMADGLVAEIGGDSTTETADDAANLTAAAEILGLSYQGDELRSAVVSAVEAAGLTD